MDTVIPAGTTTTGDTVMGNETSKIEIKHDLGDVERPGQFHRVLVEPDYSVIDPPILTKETVSSNLETTPATKLSTESAPVSENIKHKDKATVLEVDTPETDEIEPDDDHKIEILAKEIVDQVLQNVISNGKAAEKLVNGDSIQDNNGGVEHLNIATQNRQSEENAVVLEPVDDDDGTFEVNGNAQINETENVNAEEVTEISNEKGNVELDINKTQINGDIIEEKAPGSLKLKGKQNGSKAKKAEKKLRERELIESVQEQLNEPHAEVDEKKSSKTKSFMKMFKFSKRKPAAGSEPTANVTESTDGPVENHVIENLKDVPENEISKVASLDGKATLESKPIEVNGGAVVLDSVELQSTIEQNGTVTKEVNGSEQTNVETTESLDSGIVVEKLQVIQADKLENKPESDTTSTPVLSVNVYDTINTVNETNTSESAIQESLANAVKENKDVTEFNERGIDVEDITHSIEKGVITVSSAQSLEDGKKDSSNTAKMSEPEADIKELGEQTPEHKTQDKPTNVKLKKKSWSFQIGRSKKETEPQVQGTDEHKHTKQGEVKKPRWRLGKLSFRKQSSDVSVSTPDLTNPGIPEEGSSSLQTTTETKADKKKKNKLKNIKAKKEKKKESRSKDPDPFERRSNSLFDIALGDNKPGSRRSIVEDDVNYTPTDAFEGVSLSDLSADEDTHVSKNPTGSDTKPANKGNGLAAMARGLFKSDKKKVEKVPEVSDESKKISEKIKIIDDGEYAQIKDDDSKVPVEAVVDLDMENTEITVKTPENVAEKAETVDDNTAVLGDDNTAVLGDVYAQVVKQTNKEPAKDEQPLDQSQDINEPTGEYSGIAEPEENETKTSDPSCENEQTVTVDKQESSIDVQNKESCVNGHSNPIYEGDSFTIQVLKSADDVLNAGHQDSDSDAYVQLEELVSDLKPTSLAQQECTPDEQEAVLHQAEEVQGDTQTVTNENIESENNNEDDKIDNKSELDDKTGDKTDDKSELADKTADKTDNKSELDDKTADKTDDKSELADKTADKTDSKSELADRTGDKTENKSELDDKTEDKTDNKSELHDKTEELVQPVQAGNCSSEPQLTERPKRSVIIMKEVGVQAPDIHMPLDIEKDFSFPSNNLPKVSVGVQVSDDQTESNSSDDKKNSTVSAAYF